jgi:hypothetical protein
LVVGLMDQQDPAIKVGDGRHDGRHHTVDRGRVRIIDSGATIAFAVRGAQPFEKISRISVLRYPAR